MNERRAHIADAAVEIVAEHGLRGLTHRAVDAAAGLPAGSAAGIFRTRAALVTGVVDRLAERDLSFLHEFGGPQFGQDGQGFAALGLDGVVDLLAKLAVALTSPPMDRLTRARMMLAFEDSVDLGPQHRGLIVVLMGALSASGHSDPGPTARAIVDYVDGAMFHAVTLDTRAIDLAELTAMLHRLLSPVTVGSGSRLG